MTLFFDQLMQSMCGTRLPDLEKLCYSFLRILAFFYKFSRILKKGVRFIRIRKKRKKLVEFQIVYLATPLWIVWGGVGQAIAERNVGRIIIIQN